VTLHSVQGNGDQTCHPPFRLVTSNGDIGTRALVVATGGLSIPAIGATDLAYRLAQQFGINVITPRPALVPFTLTSAGWAPFAALSGLSLDVSVSIKTIPARSLSEKAKPLPPAFTEAMLLTHRGLSGPAILQISSYWESGDAIQIDLLPGQNSTAALLAAKADPQQTKQQLAHWLASKLPTRFVTTWLSAGLKTHSMPDIKRLADLSHQTLSSLGQALANWTLKPAGTEGWRKAEVTRGGIDTRELSSTSMMSKRVPGLYFIGEAVDVTGWLGGYNFQWAWASGVAAAQAAAEVTR
jgi:predicted Rossmann fold flavoprotein